MEVVSVLANFILVMVTVAKIRKTYPSMAIRHHNMVSDRHRQRQREKNQSPKGIKWSVIPLPCFSLLS